MLARYGAGLALLGLLACGVSSVEDAQVHDDAIVGGVSAKGSKLDAIGALGRISGEKFDYFCTATLISPRLIITAKHCAGRTGQKPYSETETIWFGIGDDSKAPKRKGKIDKTWMAPFEEGGFVQRGHDVAVMSLADPVEDIVPIPVAADHVDKALVGQRVSAVGYGVRDTARSSGLRRAGTLTLQSTTGPLLKGVFPTEDEAVAFAKREGGQAFSDGSDDKRVREFWARDLLADRELFAGVGAGDAQPCSGDSGGPLVGRVGDGLAVLAVVSGSFKLGNSWVNPCSVLGEVYATLSKDVQVLIDQAADAVGVPHPARVTVTELHKGSAVTLPEADAGPDAGPSPERCGAVPVAGSCDDSVTLRCISDKEGPPRVTRTDCSLLLQGCKMVVSGDAGATAECVDP
jgi:secreted trypsin-like serine protease